ncbi:MAG: hypothetical protein L0Y67_09475 [Gammaproteobacteria bacterium]|nr:hypothetical protein [Gammaproteobacteria bacterium]MCI0591799.1 hypothetical protein [Gammaproteobacteria bacterium]
MRYDLDGLADVHVYSFKETDERHRCVKGTTFRAFKRINDQLIEGEHYYYLSAKAHAELIDELRRRGRIYASSVNVVLLTELGYRLVSKSITTARSAPASNQ